MHRTKVRVVADALDANNTTASANLDRLAASIKQVDHRVMRVSAKTGEGAEQFRAWRKELPARAATEAAHDHDHDHEHLDHADHEHGTP